MDYAIKKRSPCCVCGLDMLRRSGWFLVIENRWLDRLKILSWHSTLATCDLSRGCPFDRNRRS
jgi:hypothetical protein